MGWRDVKRVEIVLFCLDLRSVEDRKSERGEEVFYLLLQLGDRMQASGPHAWGGQRDIDPFFCEAFGKFRFFKTLLLVLVVALEILFDRIEEFAERGLLGWRQFSELFADLGQSSFAPQRAHARLFEFIQ